MTQHIRRAITKTFPVLFGSAVVATLAAFTSVFIDREKEIQREKRIIYLNAVEHQKNMLLNQEQQLEEQKKKEQQQYQQQQREQELQDQQIIDFYNQNNINLFSNSSYHNTIDNLNHLSQQYTNSYPSCDSKYNNSKEEEDEDEMYNNTKENYSKQKQKRNRHKKQQLKQQQHHQQQHHQQQHHQQQRYSSSSSSGCNCSSKKHNNRQNNNDWSDYECLVTDQQNNSCKDNCNDNENNRMCAKRSGKFTYSQLLLTESRLILLQDSGALQGSIFADSDRIKVLGVKYPYCVKVCLGNKLIPSEVSREPKVAVHQRIKTRLNKQNNANYNDNCSSSSSYSSSQNDIETTDLLRPSGYYTLMLIDPDATSRATHEFRNLLHWLVVNIPIPSSSSSMSAMSSSTSCSSCSSCSTSKTLKNYRLQQLELSEANILATYIPPAPPAGTGFHRYLFLIYRQNERLNVQNIPVIPTTDLLSRRNFFPGTWANRYSTPLRLEEFNYFQTRRTTSTSTSTSTNTTTNTANNTATATGKGINTGTSIGF